MSKCGLNLLTTFIEYSQQFVTAKLTIICIHIIHIVHKRIIVSKLFWF